MIAREAGSSSYHFARLFHAFTGETPFDFMRRVRIATALRMLIEDPEVAVTEIALDVGYETPSAFNKAFKRVVEMSPSEFRNLGQAAQSDLLHGLSQPKIQKEVPVRLSKDYEIITRPAAHYVYLEKRGQFAEVAPPTWNEMSPLVFKTFPPESLREFLGLSTIDRSRMGDEAMIYQAGVTVATEPKKLPSGLEHRKMRSGDYARFLLTGPYSQIWPAFQQIFKRLAEEKIELRQDYCIENYLNNPQSTPEDQLLTEILIPVA